ncbi:MAG TPA: DUF4192 domain-containing protein [Streptosporangiaceae bacterium]|nr:DUF4192 domain-containing protein [Streptosporangiaceae bacterium]
MTESQPNGTRARHSRSPRNAPAGKGPAGPADRRPSPSGPPKKAPDPAETGAFRCKVKVGSADGVLAIVPHLLGFHPANSLVVLGIGGPHGRIRLAFRYDLPDPPDHALNADIAAHATSVLDREQLNLVVVIGYGPGQAVTGVVDALTPALGEAQIAIQDILRVEDGRYWSYLCQNPHCCPPEGSPYDPSDHPAAQALSAAGLEPRTSRADLAATLARAPESIEPIAQAMERARSRASDLISQTLAAVEGSDPLLAVADAGRRSVRRAVALYRRGGEITDLDEIAWLGITLTDLRVRDDAWARMDPQFNEAHQRLWRQLVRQLPAEFVPAPAALLAFIAWQSGDGALAAIAIERALGADPEYSMALLIADALHAGLPPSAARLSMTPKQVAASYARHRKPAPPTRRRR